MHQRGIGWEAANEGRVRRIRGARVGVGVGVGDDGDLLHERIGISVRQLWSPSDVVPRVGWGSGSGLVCHGCGQEHARVGTRIASRVRLGFSQGQQAEDRGFRLWGLPAEA